jgi:hypothetical protein
MVLRVDTAITAMTLLPPMKLPSPATVWKNCVAFYTRKACAARVCAVKDARSVTCTSAQIAANSILVPAVTRKPFLVANVIRHIILAIAWRYVFERV